MMKKLLISFFLVASSAASQVAIASCYIAMSSSAQTGQQVCRGSSTSNMTVQTCTASGAFQSQGTKCTCNGGNWVEYNGQYTCSSGYTTSSTSTGATQSKK